MYIFKFFKRLPTNPRILLLFFVIGILVTAAGIYVNHTVRLQRVKRSYLESEKMRVEEMEARKRAKRGSRKVSSPDKADVPPLNKETLLTYDKESDEFTRRDKTVENNVTAKVRDELAGTNINSFDVTYKKTYSNITIKMVAISGGSFQMGWDRGEWDENWVHEVHLNGFYISTTEITQKQFMDVMDNNPSYFQSKSTLKFFPVEQVNWYTAVEFCNRLSEFAGFEPCYDENTWDCDFSQNGFRLPTEAEWEYACRAGTTTNYYSGDEEESLKGVAWYIANSDGSTHPVGLKKPNNWGLYDIHGNVWEWCNDWYGENYYRKSPDNNPEGPETGIFKVMRGGGWTYFPYPGRSSYRGREKPAYRFDYIGFRVVRRP